MPMNNSYITAFFTQFCDLGNLICQSDCRDQLLCNIPLRLAQNRPVVVWGYFKEHNYTLMVDWWVVCCPEDLSICLYHVTKAFYTLKNEPCRFLSSHQSLACTILFSKISMNFTVLENLSLCDQLIILASTLCVYLYCCKWQECLL